MKQYQCNHCGNTVLLKQDATLMNTCPHCQEATTWALKATSAANNHHQITCVTCGREFESTVESAKYCSSACRQIALGIREPENLKLASD